MKQLTETARTRPPLVWSERGRLLGALVAFRIVLDLSYALLVSPQYSYAGFSLGLHPLKLIESYVLVLVLGLLCPVRFRRPSDVLGFTLVAAASLPILSYYALADQERGYLYVMLAGIALVLLSTRVTRTRIRGPQNHYRKVVLVSWVVILGSTIVILVRGGLSYYNLDLGAVYDFRGAAASQLGGPVFDYILSWLPRVFIPFLLASYLHTRRYLLSSMVVLYSVFFLAPISNAKSTIFIPLAIVAAYTVLSRAHRLRRVLALASVAVAAVTLIDLVFGPGILSSLLVRRALYVPALLDFGYYRTFADLGHVYWSDSVLSSFLDYPFALPPANLVGQMVIGSSDTHANNGFISTGYMHLGILGVVLYALLVGALLWLTDSISAAYRSAVVATCIVLVPFLALMIAADLPTSMATHGLALSLVALWLGPKGPRPPRNPRYRKRRRAEILGTAPGGARPTARVCHLTSVHSVADQRIFSKECRTLADAGHQVTLIGLAPEPEEGYGVDFVARSRPTSRVRRWLGTVPWVLKRAWRLDADLYHLHDPELIPVGLALLARGRFVVYDAHEDYSASILRKEWIPGPLRSPMAKAAGACEVWTCSLFDAVICATDHVERRFEGTRVTTVRNYPRIEDYVRQPRPTPTSPASLVYVGAISKDRGALQMVESIALVEAPAPPRLILGGPVRPVSLLHELERMAAWGHVDYRGIIAHTELPATIAQAQIGLVILHPTPAYRLALPVKMFEFMAAGLPVVISRPLMSAAIVEGERCGLLVDPLDVAEIAAAISWLLGHPHEAMQMGQRGREAVKRSYSWEKEGERLADLYQEILA